MKIKHETRMVKHVRTLGENPFDVVPSTVIDLICRYVFYYKDLVSFFRTIPGQVPDKYVNEKGVIKCMFGSNKDMYYVMNKTYRDDKDLICEILFRRPECFRMVKGHFRDDEDTAFAAASYEPTMLKYASKRVLSCESLYFRYAEYFGNCSIQATDKVIIALRYIHNDLKSNKAFFRRMVILYDCRVMEFANEELKDDTNLMNLCVTKAARQSYFNRTGIHTCLALASDRLKDDAGFMALVLTFSSCMFKYASERLRGDQTFALLGLENPENMKHISKDLLDNAEFLECTINFQKNSARNFEQFCIYGSERLKNDVNFLVKLIKRMGGYIRLVPEHILDNKEFILQAVKENGFNLEYASERLQDDEEVVTTAMKIKYQLDVFKYASERLQNDKEFKKSVGMST